MSDSSLVGISVGIELAIKVESLRQFAFIICTTGAL